MAVISSTESFNQAFVNLNLIYANAYSAQLYSGVNFEYNNALYKDVFEVSFSISSDHYGVADFGGTSLKLDKFGNISAGTVTGYLESYWDGSDYVPYLAIEGVAISAKALYAAAKTPSNSDDISLVNKALTKNDTFYLSDYNDIANGFAGNDTMYGNAGDDNLTGGAGQDFLFGGEGYDVFVFNSIAETSNTEAKSDIVYDFESGVDLIDLRVIDAATKISGNNSFVFNGESAFSISKEGEIYYAKFDNAGTANDYTLIYLDNDADAKSEAIIKLVGLVDLSSSDFLL